MSGVPDYTLEDTLDFKFTTRQFSTGAPFAFDSGAVEIYEDNSVAQITVGETLTLEFDGVTGLHNLRVAATAANGFENGKSYQCVVSAGTVDSVSVVGEVVQQFSIGRNGLIALGLDHLISASVSDTDVADDSIIAQMVDAGSTSDYTNYSKTEDSLRAISEKVSSIGSASGGGFNFAAVGSDALTDTINDAEAAVDKSTSPATVGIPVTGHAFLTGHEVTIGGTVNYNGSFVIDSVSTNEVVIVSSFSAETFSGTDTIVSSIKAESIEGVETTNTFSSTVSEDGVYHVIDDDGADNFTISYRFEVGGGRLATEAVFHGFLNGSNDNAFIQAYDFVGSAWETRALLTGQNGSVNQTITISLLARNTGTDATDLGVAFLRITDDAGRGSSNPTLNVDSLLVEAVGVGQTAGYQNGQIWLDTNNGTAGAEAFVNGVADEPCLIIADAKALSTSVGISDFHIINGSSITLAESTVNESYFGDNWTLALGGQDVDGAYFQGPHVTGVGTSATEVHYEGCDVGTMSVQIGHFDFCAFSGTVTQTLAGDYEYHNCYSNVAGAGAPTFTKTAGQAITAEWRNWMDSITVSGLQSGDTVTINGRLGTVTLNGADATVEIRGSYKSIANNLTGSPTVNIAGAWKGSDIADILTDTTEIGTAGAGLTDITLNAASIDLVWNEAMSGHQTQGTTGAAITMTAYLGPYGPGVYIDDGAANTGTTLGDDGTAENPVSTIAAATTIASNLGIQTFYLINDTVITLVQAYEGYTFIGLGLSNKITLGSQDVDNSEFCNLILTGTQGGTGQIYVHHCSLTALVSAELIAFHCWLTGNNTLRAATTHIFKACCSAVPGQSTPDLTFPGAGTTEVSFRNYSGGLTVKSATTNDTMSFEADGQIVIDASCTSLTISVRGNCQITDNGTTTSLTQEAAINLTNINAEVVDVMDTDTVTLPGQEAPPLAPTRTQMASWQYKSFRNRKKQDATSWELYADNETTVDAKATISDDGTDAIKQEIVSGP